MRSKRWLRASFPVASELPHGSCPGTAAVWPSSGELSIATLNGLCQCAMPHVLQDRCTGYVTRRSLFRYRCVLVLTSMFAKTRNICFSFFRQKGRHLPDLCFQPDLSPPDGGPARSANPRHRRLCDELRRHKPLYLRRPRLAGRVSAWHAITLRVLGGTRLPHLAFVLLYRCMRLPHLGVVLLWLLC